MLCQEILCGKQAHPDQNLLDLKMTSFHFPLDHTCPLQADSPHASGLMSLTVRPIKVVYMQEQFLRLADYFLVQFLQNLSDTNPYDQILD